jgi:ABC-type nitrate/sulfonate/bicarbonate transport system permease component
MDASRAVIRQVRGWNRHLFGVLPIIAVVAAWYAVSQYADIPEYKLPPLAKVADRGLSMIADGSLVMHTWESIKRLVIAFAIGNGLAIPIGITVAMNRHVADLVRPLLTFFQAIAGIAWVPLAIIWLGIGDAPVIFVIANTIFFTSIYNTVTGVESIPRTLHRAVRSLGGSGVKIYTQLVIPGALVHILLGLRTSVAYGLRAMVGAELIAGSSGLGFLIIDASHTFSTDVVIIGMIVIAILWLILDRVLFQWIERKTVVRWGVLRR